MAHASWPSKEFKPVRMGKRFPHPEEPTLNTPEPPPQQNSLPHVWDLVMKDIEDRDRLGAEKYGVHLQPHNGRDALIDAYQEALDLVVYLRQAIYEEYNR